MIGEYPTSRRYLQDRIQSLFQPCWMTTLLSSTRILVRGLVSPLKKPLSSNFSRLSIMPVAMPINTLKGTWQRLVKNDRLKRSSQILSAINGQVCIFGGEIQPRQPVDDKVDIITLNAGTSAPPLPRHHSTLASTYTNITRIVKSRDKRHARSTKPSCWYRISCRQRCIVHLFRSWRCGHGSCRRKGRSMELFTCRTVLDQIGARRHICTVSTSPQLPQRHLRRYFNILCSCWLPRFWPAI